MRKTKHATVVCQICGKQKNEAEVVPADLVRDSVVRIIRNSFPGWSSEGYICRDDLGAFRSKYVHDLLESEKGEITALEDEVMQSLKEHELLSENVNATFGETLRLGERLADRIALFGGSWAFILWLSPVCVWAGSLSTLCTCCWQNPSIPIPSFF